MTKTNTLGVVGSIPIPEVIRNINSFTLGAQSVNPKIKTKVVWVNEWFNPPKETEAAQSLINGGADVLMQNTDSSAVLQTAEKAGKCAFGWDTDMTAYGPKAHLASAIINWAPYYIKATQRRARRHLERPAQTWWGVKEGAIDIVSISDKVPAEHQGQGRDGQGRPEGRQLRDLEGPDRRQRRQGGARRRTRSPTTSSSAASTSTSRASRARCPAAASKLGALDERRPPWRPPGGLCVSLDDTAMIERAALASGGAGRRCWRRMRRWPSRCSARNWCCGAMRRARCTPGPTAARTAARGCRWAAVGGGDARVRVPRLALRGRRAAASRCPRCRPSRRRRRIAPAAMPRAEAPAWCGCGSTRRGRRARPGDARRRRARPRAAQADCGPYEVETSAPRIVENFLDMSHFGFVHEGWLGDRAHLAQPTYELGRRPPMALRRQWLQRLAAAEQPVRRLPAQVDYRYEVHRAIHGGTDQGPPQRPARLPRVDRAARVPADAGDAAGSGFAWR